MIKKKISLLFFITCSFFINGSVLAQAGYVIFGSPSETGCSGSGMCQVEATPFQSITSINQSAGTMTLTNATQMFFTSVYNEESETYTVTMIINMDALRVNQPDQVPNFQSAGGPGLRTYVMPHDAYISANVVGGALRADYLNGFMRIQAGSELPFIPALPGDHFVKLTLTSASGIRGSQHMITPASTTGDGKAAFDIQYVSTNKTTFSKDKNKHKHRHRRHHKRAGKGERRWAKRLL